MDAEIKKNGNGGNTPRDVLRLLFERGPLEQVAAARLFGITKAACNLHFQRLAQERLIEPAETNGAGRGRPARSWRVSPENAFLGVVLQRGGVFSELMNFAGECLVRENLPFPAGITQPELCTLLGEVIARSRARLTADGRVLQCFVAVPGAIAADGTILNSPNFSALNGWNPDRFSGEWQLPCFTDTLGLAAIRGETWEMPADSVSVLLDWSEGFGAMLTQNGVRLLFPAPGARRYHALWDIGHIRYKLGGRPCHCGKCGCLEAYIGGVALLEHSPELQCRTISEFVTLLNGGSAAARSRFAEAVRIMTEMLYPILELFGVESIVLSGKMRAAFPVFEEELRGALAGYYTPEEGAAISIRDGGEPFPVLSHGAALTARQYFLAPEVVGHDRGLGQNLSIQSNCQER